MSVDDVLNGKVKKPFIDPDAEKITWPLSPSTREFGYGGKSVLDDDSYAPERIKTRSRTPKQTSKQASKIDTLAVNTLMKNIQQDAFRLGYHLKLNPIISDAEFDGRGFTASIYIELNTPSTDVMDEINKALTPRMPILWNKKPKKKRKLNGK